MGEGNLCQTAQDVSRTLRIADEGGAVNKFIQNIRSHKYVDELVNRLEQLRDNLYDNEQKFFDELSIYNNDEEVNLKILQQRIDKIRNSGLSALEASSMGNTLREILKGVKFNSYSADKFKEIIEENITDFIQDENNKKIITESQEGPIVAYLNATLGGEENWKGGAFTNRSSLARIKGTIQNNKFELDIDSYLNEFGKLIIPVSMKKKVSDALLTISNKTFKEENEFFKEEVIQNLLTKLSLSGEALEAVKYQCEKNFDKYDLFSNVPNVIGFLGEVQFNSIMSLLLGETNVTPTGNLKRLDNHFKGTSIPIDSIILGFGFQIKNYSTKGEEVNFKASNKDTGTLIVDRMELSPEHPILQMLSLFQYNFPISDASDKYKQVYSHINNTMVNNLKDFFEGFIDKLIEIDSSFEAANIDQLLNTQQYLNTFFYINGKLVPSSVIVQSIIDTLNNQTKKDKPIGYFAQITEFTMSPRSTAPSFTWNPDPKKQNTTANFVNAANKIKTSYQITINLADILERAEQIGSIR